MECECSACLSGSICVKGAVSVLTYTQLLQRALGVLPLFIAALDNSMYHGGTHSIAFIISRRSHLSDVVEALANESHCSQAFVTALLQRCVNDHSAEAMLNGTS
ncbi:hypothetical protein BCR33DRAFT_740145 [Rhizoclosmatium globosum]|uniref:Uncharacterized protein n=1 Tax=Rhizoclosmatium globosum TaxID=329046 RepID=A0A1Y2C1B9_9FUNG|nr:hypothetical protein BCR33DRAFT_740145 [Rhizoclosmatium globosum]|eukprot:ORY40756.1 hypothetical protein BCR33DRAFT_740145 [Rhizoclosmatium globosum]